MQPEGMVHALEIIHRLLKPDGVLVDIHPTPEPPPILVRSSKAGVLAGWLKESDDFIEYVQADQALAQAVAMGLFHLARQGTFEFTYYAESLEDLRLYLAEKWQDAIIDQPTEVRIRELVEVGQAGGASTGTPLMMSELVRIARLLRQDIAR